MTKEWCFHGLGTTPHPPLKHSLCNVMNLMSTIKWD